MKNGVDLIVIDTAHGHSESFKTLKNKTIFLEFLSAWVILHRRSSKKLYNSGADIIKVGIGPGSICTTRMVAGIGVPQVTAIIEGKALKNKKIKIFQMEV